VAILAQLKYTVLRSIGVYKCRNEPGDAMERPLHKDTIDQPEVIAWLVPPEETHPAPTEDAKAAGHN
jgi:hypothetical protein